MAATTSNAPASSLSAAGNATESATPAGGATAGFDPGRPFPVFCERPIHRRIVAALAAAPDPQEFRALLTQTGSRYAALDRVLYPADPPDGPGHFKADDTALRQLRALNPLIDALWADVRTDPAARRIDDAFIRAFQANVSIVDISDAGLSDLGLRTYLGAHARTPDPKDAAPQDAAPEPVVRLQDIQQASDLEIFPRLSIANFKKNVRASWLEAGIIAPRTPGARDQRQSRYRIVQPCAFPQLMRIPATLAPAGAAPGSAPADPRHPFTSALCTARAQAARTLPAHLMLPAHAQARTLNPTFFDAVSRHELMGRVLTLTQRIRGQATEVAFVCAAVVENEYLGLYLVGVRIDDGAPRPWSVPVRPETVAGWDATPPVTVDAWLAARDGASLHAADAGEIEAWLQIMRRRTVTACTATTDRPLDVRVTFRDDPALAAALERVRTRRLAQYNAIARALHTGGAPARAVRLTRERDAAGARVLVWRDRVSGRNAFAAFLRQHADAVLDVQAAYAAFDPDREGSWAGAPYRYIWSRAADELVGLGASAAGILEEYERLAVARGERPRYRVSRVVGDERIRLEVVRAQDGARIAVEAGATGTVRAAEEEMEL